MKNAVAHVVLFFLLLKGGRTAALFFQSTSKCHRPSQLAVAQRGGGSRQDSVDGGGDEGRGIYTNKPLLRGEFHRIGALLYPPLLGLPLFLRSKPMRHQVATILFSLAVEGIMVISATLHTFPWKREYHHQIARKADFAMIFVGIALFYSSLGKLLLGTAVVFTGVIEPLVWICATLGVMVKCFIPDAPPWLNAGIFLIQGWAVGPLIPLLFQTTSMAEAVTLILGGISFSLGATAYSLQWPKWNKILHIFGPHEMFHIGTLFMCVSFWCTMWMRVVR